MFKRILQEGYVVSEVEVIDYFLRISAGSSSYCSEAVVSFQRLHSVVNHYDEQEGGHDVALKNTCRNLEFFGNMTVDIDCTFGVVAKGLDGLYQGLWNSMVSSDLKHWLPVDEVEGRLEVDKGGEQWKVLVIGVFNKAPEDEYLFSSASPFAEAYLVTPQDRVYKGSYPI